MPILYDMINPDLCNIDGIHFASRQVLEYILYMCIYIHTYIHIYICPMFCVHVHLEHIVDFVPDHHNNGSIKK